MKQDQELIIFVTLQFPAEHREAILAALKPAAKASNQEPGCLQYSVYKDEENPLELMLIEHWVSDEALEAHLTMPYEIELLEKVLPLLSAPPGIRRTRHA